MIAWFCTVAALLTPPSHRANGQDLSPLVIAANGRSEFNIVVPKGSLPATMLAARELQSFVWRSTGVKLPIVSSVRPKHKAIVIHNNSAYPFDGFRIEVNQGNLVITGRDSAGRVASRLGPAMRRTETLDR